MSQGTLQVTNTATILETKGSLTFCLPSKGLQSNGFNHLLKSSEKTHESEGPAEPDPPRRQVKSSRCEWISRSWAAMTIPEVSAFFHATIPF